MLVLFRKYRPDPLRFSYFFVSRSLAYFGAKRVHWQTHSDNEKKMLLKRATTCKVPLRQFAEETQCSDNRSPVFLLERLTTAICYASDRLVTAKLYSHFVFQFEHFQLSSCFECETNVSFCCHTFTFTFVLWARVNQWVRTRTWYSRARVEDMRASKKMRAITQGVQEKGLGSHSLFWSAQLKQKAFGNEETQYVTERKETVLAKKNSAASLWKTIGNATLKLTRAGASN